MDEIYNKDILSAVISTIQTKGYGFSMRFHPREGFWRVTILGEQSYLEARDPVLKTAVAEVIQKVLDGGLNG